MNNETLDRFAAALDQPALTDDEVKTLLDFTRDVAHSTERKNAPLASFLVGLAVGGAADNERGESLSGALTRIREQLPADGV